MTGEATTGGTRDDRGNQPLLDSRLILDSRAVIDAQAPVTIVAGRDLVIHFASAGVRDLAGYEPDGITGRNVADFVHPDDLALAAESVGYVLGHEGPFSPMVYRLRTADGRWLPVEVQTARVHDETGELSLVLSLRAVDDLLVLDEPLSLLARGEALDEVLACVARLVGTRFAPVATTIVWKPEDGPWRVVAHAVPEALAAAVERALGEGELLRGPPRTGLAPIPVAELDEQVGGAAAEAGWSVMWRASVVSDDGETFGEFLLWTESAITPRPAVKVRLERLRALVALAFDRDRAARRLVHAATHDALTGLPNRARYFELLERLLARGPVGVLYLDLDGFKPVNDRYGHRVGDEVLRVVADRLVANVRPGDVIARLGGDEFGVLCNGVAESHQLAQLGRRLTTAVAAPLPTSAGVVEITASVGTAIGDVSSDADAVVDAADQAMLSVKRTRPS